MCEAKAEEDFTQEEKETIIRMFIMNIDSFENNYYHYGSDGAVVGGDIVLKMGDIRMRSTDPLCFKLLTKAHKLLNDVK